MPIDQESLNLLVSLGSAVRIDANNYPRSACSLLNELTLRLECDAASRITQRGRLSRGPFSRTEALCVDAILASTRGLPSGTVAYSLLNTYADVPGGRACVDLSSVSPSVLAATVLDVLSEAEGTPVAPASKATSSSESQEPD